MYAGGAGVRFHMVVSGVHEMLLDEMNDETFGRDTDVRMPRVNLRCP